MDSELDPAAETRRELRAPVEQRERRLPSAPTLPRPEREVRGPRRNERKGVDPQDDSAPRRPDRFVPEGHEVLEVRYGPGEPVDKDVAIAAIRNAFTGRESIEELAQQAAEEVLAAAEALFEPPSGLAPGPLVAPRRSGPATASGGAMATGEDRTGADRSAEDPLADEPEDPAAAVETSDPSFADVDDGDGQPSS